MTLAAVVVRLARLRSSQVAALDARPGGSGDLPAPRCCPPSRPVFTPLPPDPHRDDHPRDPRNGCSCAVQCSAVSKFSWDGRGVDWPRGCMEEEGARAGSKGCTRQIGRCTARHDTRCDDPRTAAVATAGHETDGELFFSFPFFFLGRPHGRVRPRSISPEPWVD